MNAAKPAAPFGPDAKPQPIDSPTGQTCGDDSRADAHSSQTADEASCRELAELCLPISEERLEAMAKELQLRLEVEIPALDGYDDARRKNALPVPLSVQGGSRANSRMRRTAWLALPMAAGALVVGLWSHRESAPLPRYELSEVSDFYKEWRSPAASNTIRSSATVLHQENCVSMVLRPEHRHPRSPRVDLALAQGGQAPVAWPVVWERRGASLFPIGPCVRLPPGVGSGDWVLMALIREAGQELDPSPLLLPTSAELCAKAGPVASGQLICRSIRIEGADHAP